MFESLTDVKLYNWHGWQGETSSGCFTREKYQRPGGTVRVDEKTCWKWSRLEETCPWFLVQHEKYRWQNWWCSKTSWWVTFFILDEIFLSELYVFFFHGIQLSRAMRKCVLLYANNKGADQPGHPHSLISAFVIRCLDSIICLDSIAEISRL